MPYRWTEEFVERRFPEIVAEKRKAEGRNPDVKPTYQWLSDHGLLGVRGYAERNGKTVDEVLIEEAGFQPRQTRSLPGSHAETINLVREWLTDEDQVFSRVTDVGDIRTHISRVMEMAKEALGSVNLVRLGREPADVAVRNTIDIFEQMNRELESQGARYNYASTLVSFLDHLEMLEEIDGHPVDEVLARTNWTYDRQGGKRQLTPDQVAACWEAAETPEQHALVVTMAFCGLRPKDVTIVERENVFLDRSDPRIEFDSERKNGSGNTVILAGVEFLDDYFSYLDAEWDDWKGALFPSNRSADGTRSTRWIADQIDEVTSRASVTLDDGSQPTPKYFRQFWYAGYNRAASKYLDRVDMISDDQGSSDPEVVTYHYLPERQQRDHFRQYAQHYFEAATPGDEFVTPEEVLAAREREADPQRDLFEFQDSGSRSTGD